MKESASFLERIMPRDIDLDPEYSSLATAGKIKTFREILNDKKNGQTFKIADYGIPGLDELTKGIHEGELITVSGLTKQGKTTFAQSITHNVIKKDHPVGWFTFEVTPARFLEKFKGDEKALDFGLLPTEHRAGDLRWLFQRIAEMHVTWHTRIFVIDHLHYLFDMWGSRNVSISIGQVVRALKHLAVTGGFTIFLLCHYSKGQREENADSYENIRDSSLIAQESDAVFLIRRMQEHGEYNENALLTVEFHRRTGVMKKRVGLIKVGEFLFECELKHEDKQKEKVIRVWRLKKANSDYCNNCYRSRQMHTEQGIQKETRTSKPVVKRLYTIREASVYLGRPVSGVRALLWKGSLPFIQTGRVQYIDVKDIDSFIEQNKTKMM